MNLTRPAVVMNRKRTVKFEQDTDNYTMTHSTRFYQNTCYGGSSHQGKHEYTGSENGSEVCHKMDPKAAILGKLVVAVDGVSGKIDSLEGPSCKTKVKYLRYESKKLQNLIRTNLDLKRKRNKERKETRNTK